MSDREIIAAIEELYYKYSAQMTAAFYVAKGAVDIINKEIENDDVEEAEHNWMCTELWAQIHLSGGIALSEKLQGTINREAIANSFQDTSGNPEIIKKVDWLKEWILDEESCSMNELQDFLSYCTGVSSLPAGRQISVGEQWGDFVPVPKAHTCSFQLDLSPVPCGDRDYNDRTKEEFIRAIKDITLGCAGFTDL